MITFHGIMTKEFLKGFNGRGYVYLWLAIRSNIWMRLGQPCTYLFTEDIDHAASIQKGEIVKQARMHAIPGHIKGVSHINPEEALKAINEYHFRQKIETLNWLRLLTQEGRVDITKLCNCDIQILMSSGCKCGGQ